MDHEEAWTALKEVKRLRRYVRESKRMEKRAFLQQVFTSWKDARTPGPSQNWLKDVHVARACAQGLVQTMSPNTKKLLQRDEADFLQWCNDSYEKKCADANATDLWKAIKRHMPKMKDKVKSRAMRFTDAQETFEQHFAQNEKAVNMADEDLKEHLHAMSKWTLEKSHEIPVEIRYIPSLQELEQAIRKAKNGKACFGKFNPEWMLAAPRETAIAIFPALLDLFVFFQEPACLKGGQYFPLWKQKGNQKDPSSYRAILLSSFAGKAFHHILRQRLVRLFPKVMRGLQLGGLPRQRVQYASHVLSLMRESAAARNISHAVVFFDLTSAFYRVSKSLVVENILEYPDFQEDEEVALLPLLGESAVQRADVPPQLRAVLQETLTSSFFTVTGKAPDMSSAWIPQRGTRPGDSCADLSFSYVMARVLDGFLGEAEHLLPTMESPSSTKQTLHPVTWVDDVAILVEDRDPGELLHKVGKVVTTMKKSADAHGLTLNFQKGKTEALVRFQGPGSAGAHRKFREQGSKLILEDTSGQELQLLSTTRYSHLGMVQSASMNNQAEVATRIAKSATAFRAIKRKVLANEAIPMPKRCQLAQSLVFSRLVFGVEIWPALHVKQEDKMNSFMNKVYRVIAKKISRGEEHRFSNLEVQATVLCLPIRALIRLQRLRYFRKLGEEAPAILGDLLERDDRDSPAPWLNLIREDLEWVMAMDVDEVKGKDPQLVADWWPLVLSMGKRWDFLVSKLTAREAMANHLQAKQKWMSGKEPMSVHAEILLPEKYHRCQHCTMAFCGKAALANHMWQKHGLHAKVRSYVHGTYCGSCLRDFHSLQRVRQHLQYSRRCLDHLQSVWWPDEVVMIESDLSSSAYRTPWVRRAGPCLPNRDEWEAAAPHRLFPDEPIECKVRRCLEMCKDAADKGEQDIIRESWLNLFS